MLLIVFNLNEKFKSKEEIENDIKELNIEYMELMKKSFT